MSRIHAQGGRYEAGFTLIELLITLTITVAIMTVVLTAVDLNANITRVQSDLSDLQQSTRVAQRDMQRIVRMIGRGGLPRDFAIAVEQNAEDVEVAGKPVVDETDILTVRGAFTSPVFRIDTSDPATFVKTGDTATLQIDNVTKSAFDQPLTALHELSTPEAILLIGSQGEAVFAVVEVTAIQFDDDVTLDIQNQSRLVERATLTLSIDEDAGGHATEYLMMTSATPAILDDSVFPANLDSVAYASVLEEYKFFIREDFSIPGDDTSRPSPKLARARMLPNTDLLHPDDVLDIADNVYDFQVAFGIDLNGNGKVDIEEAGSPLAPDDDEWRWNAVGDNPAGWDGFSLQHVRLSIVGQAQTADRTYVSPPLDGLEDHDYIEDASPGPDEIAERRYRRRLIQSTVDLRNL